MIRVVGANPALDRTHIISAIQLGEVNRVESTGSFAGGKGLDVARTVRKLGAPVTVYGFLGGEIGAAIRTACTDLGIEDKHTEIAGTTRICNIYLETDGKQATVINERGPCVTKAEQEHLVQSLLRDVQDGDFIILSGSLPTGVPDDFYARIIRELSDKSVYTIVDATGNVLRSVIDSKPWMIKPNVREFAEVFPGSENENTLHKQIKSAVEDGISHVVVTLGDKGCIAANQQKSFYVRVPAVEPVNPIASGDTFVGGFTVKYSESGDFEASVRFGSACAVANTLNEMPDLPDGFDLIALEEKMAVVVVG